VQGRAHGPAKATAASTASRHAPQAQAAWKLLRLAEKVGGTLAVCGTAEVVKQKQQQSKTGRDKGQPPKTATATATQRALSNTDCTVGDAVTIRSPPHMEGLSWKIRQSGDERATSKLDHQEHSRCTLAEPDSSCSPLNSTFVGLSYLRA